MTEKDKHKTVDTDTTHVDESESNVQVDLYGIKGRIAPAELGEEEPKTWREVGARLDQYLRNFVTHLAGIISDLPKGVRLILRGIATPSEEKTIHNADTQRKVERIERLWADKIEQGQLKSLEVSEARERFEAVIKDLVERGVEVTMEDGVLKIVAVRPEHQEIAHEKIDEALKALPGRAFEERNVRAISVLNLNQHIQDSLEAAGIDSVETLAAKSTAELKAINGIGESAIQAIREELAAVGLTTRDEDQGTAE